MSLWEFMSLVKNHTPAREVMATTAMEAAGLTIDGGTISKHLTKPSDPVRSSFVCSIISERKQRPHYRLSNQICGRQKHSVGVYRKHGHFCPTFRDKIDESFLRFFSLTLVLLNIYSTARNLVLKMNETIEKYSQARYARKISKVVIFLVKSDSVR